MIFIGIGANLPQRDGLTPLDTCRAAISAIAAIPHVKLATTSSWWESTPVPPSEQPLYINGVAELLTSLSPEMLLSQLMAVENLFGRERQASNAARTLDLDIICMGNLVRDSPDPVLPHPRAHLRAFVLKPLLEIAPNWVHPKLGYRGERLLNDIRDQPCRRL